VSECIYPAEFPLLFSGVAGVAARKMRWPIRPGRFYFRNWANIFHIHLYAKISVVCFPSNYLGLVFVWILLLHGVYGEGVGRYVVRVGNASS